MYRILIRDNQTKEERLSRPFDFGEFDDGQLFWLTEGNYGCDCNRSLEFQRSDGRHESLVHWNQPCGNERFSILKAILSDGSEREVDDLTLEAEFLV
jgi:hypothetical protein